MRKLLNISLILAILSLFLFSCKSNEKQPKDSTERYPEIERVEIDTDSLYEKVGTTCNEVMNFIEKTKPINIKLEDFEHLNKNIKGRKKDTKKTYVFDLDDGKLQLDTIEIGLEPRITYIKIKPNDEDQKEYTKNIEKEQRDKVREKNK